MEDIRSSQFTNSKNKIYIIVAILISTIIVSFLWLNYYSNRFNTHNKHITYAVTNIKYLVTKSNLSLKEYFAKHNMECNTSYSYIQDSLDMANTLLFGGVIRGFKYDAQYNNVEIIKSIQSIKKLIVHLKEIREKIISSNTKTIEAQMPYRKNYQNLIEELEALDMMIVKRFKKMYTRYEAIKYSIYISLVLLILVGIYLIKNLNKDIEHSTLLSYVDSLTKVQNVKSYKKEISRLFYMYKRYGNIFSAILIDIDDFKNINDSYGHSIGDKVLIDFANLLSQNIRRNSDMLFRIGGEEFIILCPNITTNDGKNMAEKLREKIKEGVNIIKDKTVTASIGVTQIQEKDTPQILFDRVDKLLYTSKTTGKDKVSCS